MVEGNGVVRRELVGGEGSIRQLEILLLVSAPRGRPQLQQEQEGQGDKQGAGAACVLDAEEPTLKELEQTL
jgi:hypothetical protein